MDNLIKKLRLAAAAVADWDFSKSSDEDQIYALNFGYITVAFMKRNEDIYPLELRIWESVDDTRKKTSYNCPLGTPLTVSDERFITTLLKIRSDEPGTSYGNWVLTAKLDPYYSVINQQFYPTQLVNQAIKEDVFRLDQYIISVPKPIKGKMQAAKSKFLFLLDLPTLPKNLGTGLGFTNSSLFETLTASVLPYIDVDKLADRLAAPQYHGAFISAFNFKNVISAIQLQHKVHVCRVAFSNKMDSLIQDLLDESSKVRIRAETIAELARFRDNPQAWREYCSKHYQGITNTIKVDDLDHLLNEVRKGLKHVPGTVEFKKSSSSLVHSKILNRNLTIFEEGTVTNKVFPGRKLLPAVVFESLGMKDTKTASVLNKFSFPGMRSGSLEHLLMIKEMHEPLADAKVSVESLLNVGGTFFQSANQLSPDGESPGGSTKATGKFKMAFDHVLELFIKEPTHFKSIRINSKSASGFFPDSSLSFAYNPAQKLEGLVAALDGLKDGAYNVTTRLQNEQVFGKERPYFNEKGERKFYSGHDCNLTYLEENYHMDVRSLAGAPNNLKKLLRAQRIRYAYAASSHVNFFLNLLVNPMMESIVQTFPKTFKHGDVNKFADELTSSGKLIGGFDFSGFDLSIPVELRHIFSERLISFTPNEHPWFAVRNFLRDPKIVFPYNFGNRVEVFERSLKIGNPSGWAAVKIFGCSVAITIVAVAILEYLKLDVNVENIRAFLAHELPLKCKNNSDDNLVIADPDFEVDVDSLSNLLANAALQVGITVDVDIGETIYNGMTVRTSMNGQEIEVMPRASSFVGKILAPERSMGARLREFAALGWLIRFEDVYSKNPQCYNIMLAWKTAFHKIYGVAMDHYWDRIIPLKLDMLKHKLAQMGLPADETLVRKLSLLLDDPGKVHSIFSAEAHLLEDFFPGVAFLPVQVQKVWENNLSNNTLRNELLTLAQEGGIFSE